MALPLAAPRSLRPWGWFELLAEGPGYRVKRLRIEAGLRLSRQRHHHRSEHWVVVAGEGTAELEGRPLALLPGSTLLIPLGAVHRAAAGAAPLEIIEVQRGALLREDDIERLADDFGRVAGDRVPSPP
ncbi:MAG: phosphomannose isomerase type II C-terminal cupin domain [Synechococcaceae cyanobacterium]|nr:phosphomannose isomerase type II C-terminal cupin domain [Synechococcaceae cyanobacterium]